MNSVERAPDRDRSPSGGLDLMPGLLILFRSTSHTLAGLALVDYGVTVGVLPARSHDKYRCGGGERDRSWSPDCPGGDETSRDISD